MKPTLTEISGHVRVLPEPSESPDVEVRILRAEDGSSVRFEIDRTTGRIKMFPPEPRKGGA